MYHSFSGTPRTQLHKFTWRKKCNTYNTLHVTCEEHVTQNNTCYVNRGNNANFKVIRAMHANVTQHQSQHICSDLVQSPPLTRPSPAMQSPVDHATYSPAATCPVDRIREMIDRDFAGRGARVDLDEDRYVEYINLLLTIYHKHTRANQDEMTLTFILRRDDRSSPRLGDYFGIPTQVVMQRDQVNGHLMALLGENTYAELGILLTNEDIEAIESLSGRRPQPFISLVGVDAEFAAAPWYNDDNCCRYRPRLSVRQYFFKDMIQELQCQMNVYSIRAVDSRVIRAALASLA